MTAGTTGGETTPTAAGGVTGATSTLVEDLVGAGIQHVYAYPGWPVDDVLALIDESSEIELIITVSEAAAVSAAHGHWLVTGRACAVMVSDGAGVETAAAMLALAVREGAGMLLVLPGLLPTPTRSGAILEAVGAVVLDLHSWDPCAAVELAAAGHVVAVVPGWSTPLPVLPQQPAAARGHHGILVGPRATATELTRLESHTCPVITTAGVRPPDSVLQRWLGSITLGTHPGVFDLIGMGTADGTGSVVAGVGCPPALGNWLLSIEARSEIVPETAAGPCLAAAGMPPTTGTAAGMTPGPGANSRITAGAPIPALTVADGFAVANGFAVFNALVAVADALPAAILVADAGAGHKLTSYAARRADRAVVATLGPTTMGWGPGAALGAAAATQAPVVLTIGDGSLAMAGLQLLDWQRRGVRGVIVAARNGQLGSVIARVGGDHPNLTTCALSIPALFDSMGIPWREVTKGEDPGTAAAWAAGIAQAADGHDLGTAAAWPGGIAQTGGVAALIVDTHDGHGAEYTLATGMRWWDEITSGASTFPT